MTAEERANTYTHLPALIASIGVIYPLLHLVVSTQSVVAIVGICLFLAGQVLMYASSTFYHAVSEPVHKYRLRVLDHIAIYVMIAGSYSPICLSVVGGWIGWSLFVFLWLCVIAGIVGKIVALGKHPKLSLVLYLIMGWVALLIIVPMWREMPHSAFWWVVAEGVFYTIGAYFFRLDEERAFYHAIWHIFIILGSMSHTIAMFLLFL